MLSGASSASSGSSSSTCLVLVSLLLGLSQTPRGALAAKRGCTTLAVGKKASASGATFVTHSVDCETCDSRVVYVPPQDHAPGKQRPVYPDTAGYPRYVGYDRGEDYYPKPGQTPTPPMGFMDQVPHTYGYHEGAYGLMNEKGLAIGESSASGQFMNNAKYPEGYPEEIINAATPNRTQGKALLCIGVLTQIAMERCATARCAIETMGKAANTYGFYGEDANQTSAGEVLTLADGEEAWVFHIQSGPHEQGALWVAQRVKEDHVAVAADNFIIRTIPRHPTEDFLMSENLHDVAHEHGFWKPEDGDMDFSRQMAPDPLGYSYWQGYPPAPRYYSLRLWRIFDRMAPSLKLAPPSIHKADSVENDPLKYPFSVKPDKLLEREDLMNLYRDYFEGTEFDLTKGMLAGPFGNPNRFEAPLPAPVNGPWRHGEFARPTSLMRTSYVHVSEAHPPSSNIPAKLWFAMDQPPTSVFVPFLAASDGRGTHPQYSTGDMGQFAYRTSAWWAFDFVNNWMTGINYQLMNQEVQPKLKVLQETAIHVGLNELDRAAREMDVEALNSAQRKLQGEIANTWWDFADYLVARYNDGFISLADQGPTRYGYPAWWLNQLDFSDDLHTKACDAKAAEDKAERGERKSTTLELLGSGSNTVTVAEQEEEEEEVVRIPAGTSVAVGVCALGVTALFGFALGVSFQRRRGGPEPEPGALSSLSCSGDEPALSGYLLVK